MLLDASLQHAFFGLHMAESGHFKGKKLPKIWAYEFLWMII